LVQRVAIGYVENLVRGSQPELCLHTKPCLRFLSPLTGQRFELTVAPREPILDRGALLVHDDDRDVGKDLLGGAGSVKVSTVGGCWDSSSMMTGWMLLHSKLLIT